jgi:dGTPase
LADVTQVVPANEGCGFHNRLTHSLEVAQFGRRLAEKLVRRNPLLADGVGGIDPDVVEAACLAHDLGHPPFGHVAEEELNHLVTNKANIRSGFEGNAQSFRIVTKLADHYPCPQGLNLTRATLNALLKYPWLRDTPGTPWIKWGAYDTEILELRNVRKSSIPAESLLEESQWAEQFSLERELNRAELDWPNEHSFLRNKGQTVEATLVNLADDVTYAVHDAVDFYCAGLIPLDRLNSHKDDSERKRFFDEVFNRHKKLRLPLPDDRSVLEHSFEELIMEFPNIGSYEGMRLQRTNLVNHTAFLISRYIDGVELVAPAGSRGSVQIHHEFKNEVFMLKQLTW